MLSEIKQKKLRDYFLEAPIKRGIMLCGHGSRSVSAVHEFSGLVNKLKNLLPYIPIEYGYLEFAKPIINEGIEKLRKEMRLLSEELKFEEAGLVRDKIKILKKMELAHIGEIA